MDQQLRKEFRDWKTEAEDRLKRLEDVISQINDQRGTSSAKKVQTGDDPQKDAK